MSSTRRTLAAMLLHRTKDFRQLRNAEGRRNCLQCRAHQLVSNKKWPDLRTHIQASLYRVGKLFLMYVRK